MKSNRRAVAASALTYSALLILMNLACNPRRSDSSSEVRTTSSESSESYLSLQLEAEGLNADIMVAARLTYVSENCRDTHFTESGIKRIPESRQKVIRLSKVSQAKSLYMLAAPLEVVESRLGGLSSCKFQLSLSSSIDSESGILVGSTGSLNFLKQSELSRWIQNPKLAGSGGIVLTADERNQSQKQKLTCSKDSENLKPVCRQQVIKLGPNLTATAKIEIAD